MFNTTIHQAPDHVPYEKSVKITEKRAPTDDSIRLANEFEEKIQKNIVAKGAIKNNLVKDAVFAVFNDQMRCVQTYRIAFKLNNELVEVEGDFPFPDFKLNRSTAMMEMTKAVCDSIAKELTVMLLSKNLHNKS